MEQIELTVEGRDVSGSDAAKRLRSSGFLPGVVYTGGEEAVSVKVNTHDFIMTVRNCVPAQIFKLKSDNAAVDGKSAIVKDVQKEPLKERLLHVDFLLVKEGQKVTVTVPVEIVGQSPAVRVGRAIMSQTVYELRVDCAPAAIPSKLTIDVSTLEEGQSIQAGDIELPEDVVLKSSPNLSIVSAISNKRAAKAGEEEEESAA